MAAVNAGLPREGAAEGQEPLALAMQLMAQALAQMQTAVRQQEQRRQEDQAAISALTARVHQQDERRQEDQAAITALTARVRRLEERGGVAAEQQPLEPLERRMGNLEASVQRALESVFPRVEALVAQLETSSPPAAPSSSISNSSPSRIPPGSRSLHASSSAGAGADRLVSPVVREALERDLLDAAREGRLAFVRRLLDGGVNVNCRDGNGWTPLIVAACVARAPVLELLLSRGADVSLTISEDGCTVLHMVTVTDCQMTGRCVRLLVDAGADVHSRDKLGNTPLHWATRGFNTAAAHALQACGASATARNYNGQMPLALVTRDLTSELRHDLA